jgi:cation transport protein ChaC
MDQPTYEIYNNNIEWVFGYGSLMWDPGFAYIGKQPATLTGFHRSFCIYSHHYRGTPERPGLVLGLDEGGVCQGIAFRVDRSKWLNVVNYLDKRELIGYAYQGVKVDIKFERSGTVAQAYTYIADPSHLKYAGNIGFKRSVDTIMNGVGVGGLNRDYLISLLRQLKSYGYEEPYLYQLMDRIELLTEIID